MSFDKQTYDREYSKTNYDRIVVYVQKGKRDELKAIAKERGLSLNECIKVALHNTYGVTLL
jgi:hypothetical protein